MTLCGTRWTNARHLHVFAENVATSFVCKKNENRWTPQKNEFCSNQEAAKNARIFWHVHSCASRQSHFLASTKWSGSQDTIGWPNGYSYFFVWFWGITCSRIWNRLVNWGYHLAFFLIQDDRQDDRQNRVFTTINPVHIRMGRFIYK